MKTINEGQTDKKQEKKNEKKSVLAGVVTTCPGSNRAPVYKRIKVEGVSEPVVQKVDETDLYEFIQASAAQTDLALLQKRFIELGEIPNVNPDLKFGVDNTAVPNDIHGIYAMVNDIAGNFAKLPQSIQEIFGTKEAYMKALLDGSYQATLINAINAKKAENKENEKKEGNV